MAASRSIHTPADTPLRPELVLTPDVTVRPRQADAPVVAGAGFDHDTERPDVATASDEYAARRFGGAVGEWLLAQQTDLIGRLLERIGTGPLRILEVGGGHAQVTPLLLARNHHVVVHGSDPVCFRRLELLRARHPDRLRTCVSRLWNLPFPDRSFDAVIAVRLLGHVVRWRELLAEMARVSSGHLILEFARPGAPLLPRRLIFAMKRRVERTTRPFFSYPEDALAAELKAQSFRPEDTIAPAQFVFPMVLHRAARLPRVSDGAERLLRSLGLGDASRSPAIMLARRIEHP